MTRSRVKEYGPQWCDILKHHKVGTEVRGDEVRDQGSKGLRPSGLETSQGGYSQRLEVTKSGVKWSWAQQARDVTSSIITRWVQRLEVTRSGVKWSYTQLQKLGGGV